MGIVVERVERGPSGGRRIFVNADMTSVTLDLDVATASQKLGPEFQANRVRRLLQRLDSWREEPVTGDNVALLLDDYFNAAIALKHTYDWVQEAAAAKGLQADADAMNAQPEGRILSDIANGTKHLRFLPGRRKTSGPLQLTAKAKLGAPAKEYLDSLEINSEGKVWKARQLLQKLYEQWVSFIEERLGLSLKWVLRDDASEAVRREIEERLERHLNVEYAKVRLMELSRGPEGLVLKVAGRVTPLPTHDGDDVAYQMPLVVLRGLYERKSVDRVETLLALDGLIVSLEEVSRGRAPTKVLDEAIAWWKELRAEELAERSRAEKAGTA